MTLNRTPPYKGDKPPDTTLNGKRSHRDLIDDSTSPPGTRKRINSLPDCVTLSEMAKKPKNTDSKRSHQDTKISFNVPVNNQFTLLNKNNDKSSNTAISKNADAQFKTKQSIPPITIIGASNFAGASKIVREIANDNYFMKYMSIGVKFLINDLDHYKTIKEKLISSKIEFYSHDINAEKYDQFILSGINRVDTQDLLAELKSKDLEAEYITEIPINNPRFLNEGVYRIAFKRNTVNLHQLNQIRLNHTIVKWRINKNPKKLTQCRRCQNFGHGSRNCYVSIKCSKCGENHVASECSADLAKCANCGGTHLATSVDCPKRIAFLDMRQKMSAKNNRSKNGHTRTAPRINSPIMFPELHRKSSELPTSNMIWPFVNKTTFNNIVSQNSQSSASTLFTPDEIKVVLPAIFQGLKKCQTKEEQLQVMFEIAAQYIYGQP